MTAAPLVPDEGRPGGRVVPLRPDQVLDAEVVQHTGHIDSEPSKPAALSPLQLAVQRLERPLPSLQRVRASAGWWTVHGSVALRSLLLRLPVLVLRELVPIGRGIGRVASAWAGWVQCTEQAARIAADEPKGRAKAGEALEARKSGRRKLTAAVAALVAAGWLWLYLARPEQAAGITLLVALAAVVALDLIGRRGQPKPGPSKVLPALPSALADGVPLSKVTASILEAFEREGFVEQNGGVDVGTVRVAAPLTFDPDRREYRMRLQCPDEIEPRHLRAVERAVGAARHAARLLGTDNAAVRELVLRIGDPLANLAERPFLPSGSRSVTEPVVLGVSMTEVPFALPFAGVHMKVVMGTGGGKSRWFLRSAIDGLSACSDVVIGGIDLTGADEFLLWRDVIQRKAFTPEDAEAMLDEALAEMDRRARILADIAEDDDPDNDTDEWHAGLGPAYVIFIDEYPQLVVFDGKGGTKDEPALNLLAKCEKILRVGRKYWVSLVVLAQKTGNSDFGSMVVQSQCTVSIAGPCDMADTVRTFGVERRDAGYDPHLLSPGVKGDIRDAGKVLIDSPMHRTPDRYRCFAPGSNAEVKRRARQRIADGLPSLDGHRRGDVDEAVEVPEILALLQRAFAANGDPEQLATAAVLDFLGDDWSGKSLAAALKPHGVRPGEYRPRPGAAKVRGYLRADVEDAVRRLG